ncbi:hypothetical protein V1520DRAFT_338642 [Lipomyces starkeyi]
MPPINDFPRMAVAARDFLAIPASEVSVERPFNAGRDDADVDAAARCIGVRSRAEQCVSLAFCGLRLSFCGLCPRLSYACHFVP